MSTNTPIYVGTATLALSFSTFELLITDETTTNAPSTLLCRQLVEVHALLSSGGLMSGPRTVDTLLWAEETGGKYLTFIHKFFQMGCDRRYYHIGLRGKPMALERVSSCDMLLYLRENQW